MVLRPTRGSRPLAAPCDPPGTKALSWTTSCASRTHRSGSVLYFTALRSQSVCAAVEPAQKVAKKGSYHRWLRAFHAMHFHCTFHEAVRVWAVTLNPKVHPMAYQQLRAWAHAQRGPPARCLGRGRLLLVRLGLAQVLGAGAHDQRRRRVGIRV